MSQHDFFLSWLSVTVSEVLYKQTNKQTKLGIYYKQKMTASERDMLSK